MDRFLETIFLRLPGVKGKKGKSFIQFGTSRTPMKVKVFKIALVFLHH